MQPRCMPAKNIAVGATGLRKFAAATVQLNLYFIMCVSLQYYGQTRSFTGLFLFFLLGGLLLPVLPQPAVAQSYDIDAISRGVVQVRSEGGTGSGSLMRRGDRYYVLTNRHVVEGYTSFIIAGLQNLNAPAVPMYEAELVSFSTDYDMALLRITADNSGRSVTATSAPDLPHLRFASSTTNMSRGDEIGIFGYPGIGDNELVYTTGIISSIQYGEYGGREIPVWYRTNAQMSPGNSGGIAVNSRGEVIGVPTYVRTESRTGGRLGSLLAVDLIFSVIEQDDMTGSWNSYEEETFTALDPQADPTFESVSLTPGNLGGEQNFSTVAGGSVRVDDVGPGCVGYAAASPDIRLEWSGSISELFIYFEADDSEDDATLLVQQPDGSWSCSDDMSSGVLNPGLGLSSPASGTYNIWIGSYHEGIFIPGEVAVSAGNPGGIAAGGNPGGGGSNNATAGVLDWRMEPSFGSVSLSAGFTPDPHSASVISGGSVNTGSLDLGSGCLGYAASAPDYRLNWSGNSSELYLFFVAENEGDDTTILVSQPDGSWVCNDDIDSDNLNPGLLVPNPADGQYDIWVGSYSEGASVAGQLFISEGQNAATSNGSGGTSASLDFTLEAHYGIGSLEPGFTPDPHRQRIVAGGSVDVSSQNLGSGCRGYAATAPDYSLRWGGGSRLTFYFVAATTGDDTTMIINTPSGEWLCNDDGGSGTLNPAVSLNSAASGRYDIWIGTYNNGDFIEGELRVSELSVDVP